MPMGSVLLRPGIQTELTPTLNEAGYSASRLGRFKNQLFQKIGGWIKFYPFALGGIPRALHAWQDLNDEQHLAAGTTTELDVITDGTLQDISPQFLVSDFTPDFETSMGSPNVIVDDPNISNVTIYDSVEFMTPVSVGGIILSGTYAIALNLGTTTYHIIAAANAAATVSPGAGAVPDFDTTSGSAFVVVTLEDHGLSVGDSIVFPLSTTVGGVTIFGTYLATAVGTVDEFTIAVDMEASSTTSAFMNGGDAQIIYRIALGPQAVGTGYGIGTYGSGGYGTGTTSSAQTGAPLPATDYTLDNWGEILLACPANGGIYQWRPNSGIQNAQLVATAPSKNTGMFVSSQLQMLIAYGSTDEQAIGENQDPLLVKWSNQSDYTDFVVSSTSQAGSRRLSTGSRIVGGMTAPQYELIWTDLDLWAMQYIQPPLVFGFNQIGASCGLISKFGAGRLGGVIYWMGNSNFFLLGGGGVQVIPCSVWDVVFQDLDRDNVHKIRCCPNTPFNEVMWEYPSESGGTGENDSYVKFNIVESTWDYGPLARSAWIDQSVLGMPIGATPGGILYHHEMGENDDGAPINASFTTGYWSISDGNDIAFVDYVIPDMRWGKFNGAQTASIQITLYSVMFPGDTPRVYGPYTVTQGTDSINTRLRGRQMAVKVESNDIDSFWRLGRIKWRFAPDGRR